MGTEVTVAELIRIFRGGIKLSDSELICEQCGSKNGEECIDPFLWEIELIEEKCVLCDSCLDERWDEI